jgi:hypothetical protein
MLVGAFTPDPGQMQVDRPLFGLNLQSTWLYGFFRDEDGRLFSTERKFIGSLTSGLFLMTGKEGEFAVSKDSGRSARGEVRRTLGLDERKWYDPVFHRLPAGTVREDEQTCELSFTGSRLTYGEGDLLSLGGPSTGLGLQYFSGSRDNPLLYTATCYWVSGEIQGRKVEGPIFYDNAYWRHGLDWKDYGYYNDLQIAWLHFANKFEDGTFEDGTFQFGHLISGKDGFSPGVVIRGNEIEAMTPQTEATFKVDDERWPLAAEYDVAGTVYHFTGEPNGFMKEFSASRWANYRVQCGQVSKADETRKRLDGFTWAESFADRMAEAGYIN